MSTHIAFVLDSSGSMSKIAEDTKGGFNTFVEDQREEDGKATVSLHSFATHVDSVYEAKEIEDAPLLTDENYTPQGQTALHDAIVEAIDCADAFVDEAEAEDEPENVIVVVLTDGKENASETPHDVVREQVEAHQEKGWEFLFIGANQDAALTASEMGVDRDKSLDMAHSGEGTQAAYDATSEQVSNVRQTGSTSGFTDDDRKRQNDVQ